MAGLMAERREDLTGFPTDFETVSWTAASMVTYWVDTTAALTVALTAYKSAAGMADD